MSETLEALLMTWCDTARRHTRYAIAAPFFSSALGGIKCYSDGKRLAWVPAPGCETTPNTPDLTRTVVDVKRGLADLHPFPPMPAPETEYTECDECCGEGAPRPCASCDGTGEVKCDHCGQDMMCAECDGYPWAQVPHPIGPLPPCEDCNGLGKRSAPGKIVPFAGKMFDQLYLSAAAALPGAAWKLGSVETPFCKSEDALLVAFDGGSAIVMPSDVP